MKIGGLKDLAGNKTVFITGASRGIGRAIARAFARNGYNVAVNCVKNVEMLEILVKELEENGVKALAVPCDVRDYELVKRAFEKTEALLGPVDVLVNNAGTSHIGLFNLMEPREWWELIDVNIIGILNASQIALTGMLSRQRGVIINISSVWGNSGASCEAVYSMTKGAVNAFTRALAKESAPNGVRVNAIACGLIDTDMNAFLSRAELDKLRESIPMGRIGTPEDAAQLAMFLASPEAEYITGQIIGLDGGWI